MNIKFFALLLLLSFLYACNTPTKAQKELPSYINQVLPEKYESDTLIRSDSDWKARLTAFEYNVLREKGTERAYTGIYYKTKDKGKYFCKGCNLELFTSDDKFNSHCGWPSFSLPSEKQNIKYTPDNTAGMNRVEITCARCDSHLGHIFNDGPKPSGLRYCVNSASIDFVEEE
jgi:peptide-methionine (R)-S-oxide reductase